MDEIIEAILKSDNFQTDMELIDDPWHYIIKYGNAELDWLEYIETVWYED